MDKIEIPNAGIIFIKLKILDGTQLTAELKEKLHDAIRDAGISFEEVLEFLDIIIHGETVERRFHIEPSVNRKKAGGRKKREMINKIGIRHMDVPICSRCHFNDQVGKNIVEKDILLVKYNELEWFCHRCKLPFK